MAGINHLSVTDSGQSNDRHVERLKKANRVAAQNPVTRHAENNDGQQ